jgi:UDP-N-acetylglucosamine:LPS N-acetylglucosamine transferase
MAATTIRVLAIASGGGHWVQLLRLRPAWDGCAVTYATVHADSAVDIAPAPLLTFTDASRRDWWRLAIVAVEMLGIVLRVRPHVIVTTGAAPPLFALLFGRLLGARTLWIDSIANGEVLSSSGRLAARVATQRLTQWPDLATDKVAYWGSVL